LIDQSPRFLTDPDWDLGIYGNFSDRDNRDFIEHMKMDFAESVLRLAANGNNARVTRAYQNDTKAIQQLRQYFRGLNPAPLIQCWESMAAADYRDVLPRIVVPTLLIHGDESQFYGPEVARYLRDHIPDATLSIYENADHSPQVCQPGRFLEDLRFFLA
jgi:non-heme chloroperoxidase